MITHKQITFRKLTEVNQMTGCKAENCFTFLIYTTIALLHT